MRKQLRSRRTPTFLNAVSAARILGGRSRRVDEGRNDGSNTVGVIRLRLPLRERRGGLALDDSALNYGSVTNKTNYLRFQEGVRLTLLLAAP